MRQVQVTVRQVDKVNELLDGALKLGLNEIRDVKFDVTNPTIYREQVRQKAIENAILQARSLAAGFKVKLGPVYSIRYHTDNYQPRPVMYNSVRAASPSNQDKTYKQEIIHFDDRVDVVFELQTRANTAR